MSCPKYNIQIIFYHEFFFIFGSGPRLVSGVKKYNSLHSLKSDTRVKSSKSQDSQRSIKGKRLTCSVTEQKVLTLYTNIESECMSESR